MPKENKKKSMQQRMERTYLGNTGGTAGLKKKRGEISCKDMHGFVKVLGKRKETDILID